jgi:pimeloyl-ACP methyl ester carboxylesterase
VATYVLVPGGGHGGWCYQPVAKLLRAQGHQVYAPTLTGLADRSHLLSSDVDLDFHIRDVVRILRYEDLHDVILVGHGYGGMVITGVADREPARVGHRVYLDAATPSHGQSLSDLAPGPIEIVRRDIVEMNGVQLCLFPTVDIIAVLGVVDATVLEWMVPRLTPHPWRCFEQPLRLENPQAVDDIPQSQITSTMSACRDMEHLRDITHGRVWQRRTGHDMMLTEPQWVADKLAATAEWLPAHPGG